MALIGKRNTLSVLHEATPGFFLDGGAHGEILLPGRYRTPEIKTGKTVDVFVYRDSEDRLVATTELPYAEVNEFAYLRVVSVNAKIGAFLDWGLEKDLLLPIREWAAPVKTGDWVVVIVLLDRRTDRIVATARVERYLDLTPATYREGQPVKLLVAGETPLGYRAIVEGRHTGLLYRSDLAEPLGLGQPLDGFVKLVRPDGKIDLTLHQAGYERIQPLTEEILELLKESGGRLPYHDDSSPEEIRAAFGVSKKAFKQAIGALFRERRITIRKDGIRLARTDASK